MKFVVEETEGFESGGRMVRVFNVCSDGSKMRETTQVWVTPSGANCVGCSSPLRGMSGSCRHATAVKRRLK